MLRNVTQFMTPRTASFALLLGGAMWGLFWMPVRYLELGSRAARAVGRIQISQGLGYGCGFMVSPRLMLTCHHILSEYCVWDGLLR